MQLVATVEVVSRLAELARAFFPDFRSETPDVATVVGARDCVRPRSIFADFFGLQQKGLYSIRVYMALFAVKPRSHLAKKP